MHVWCSFEYTRSWPHFLTDGIQFMQNIKSLSLLGWVKDPMSRGHTNQSSISPVSVIMQSTSSSSQVWSGGPVGLSLVVSVTSVVVSSSEVVVISGTSVTMRSVGIAIVVYPSKKKKKKTHQLYLYV